MDNKGNSFPNAWCTIEMQGSPQNLKWRENNLKKAADSASKKTWSGFVRVTWKGGGDHHLLLGGLRAFLGKF